MALSVYNTLTRRKEAFEPLDAPKVGLYLCGLTVYDYAHIGHARTAVAFEVIRRWLQHRGYEVLFVQNVTDVDDRIIDRANELGRDPVEHAKEWDEICERHMRRLGVPPPAVHPHVTSHMGHIVALIDRLIEKESAYVADDGSVYYSVASKRDYGKLSNRTPADLLAGARVEPAAGKRDPKDFALWKAAKPGEPTWDSPWGKGRPGWHIECSAMSMAYLGESFDIHGGGVDLVFPHHENEIAQSESATGKPFVKYWLHTGFLTVDGEKMSKSLKNYTTIKDILRRHDPEAIRFFYAHTHYRSPIDYSDGAMADAAKGLERLHRVREALVGAAAGGRTSEAGDKVLATAVERLGVDFGAAMDDDFNTREAIAALFGFVTNANKAITEGVGAEAARSALREYVSIASVLTILESPRTPAGAGPDGHAERLIQLLVEVREAARAKKVFEISDRIRDELKAAGIELSDTKEGPVWRQVG